MSALPATRDQLLRRLSVAAELEHGLCLQYLFTAATLKDSRAEGGLTETELLRVRSWKATLNFVAAQEMLHLAQVCNLTTAIGGRPHLRRPNFPQRPGYYPTGLPWGLWPFRSEVIELFAWYERPAHWQHRPAAFRNLERLGPDAAVAFLTDSPAVKDPFAHLPDLFDRPRASRHDTIGELYAAIAHGFRTVPDVIIGDRAQQLDGRRTASPQLIQIIDITTALSAIDLIVEQGEGYTDDRPDSHLGAFLTIHRELAELSHRDGFRPARDVAANPLSRLHVDNIYPGWRLSQDDTTRAVNDLTNGVYRAILDLLHLAITQPGDTADRAGYDSLLLMTGVLAPLTETLTQLPMGRDGSPGDETRPAHAGPSFELSAQHEMPTGAAAHTVLRERLAELSQQAQQIVIQHPISATIGSVGTTLQDIAETLGRHATPSDSELPRTAAKNL
jgi:hypothetical protein